MGVEFVVLYTDVVLWFLAAAVFWYGRSVMKSEELRARWRLVLGNKTALACGAVLSVFLVVALVDSVHFREALPVNAGSVTVYDTKTISLLDKWVGENIAARERSYSAPMALREFDKTTAVINGKPVRDFQRLKGAGLGLTDETVHVARLRQVEVAVITGAGCLIGFWGLLSLIGSCCWRCSPLRSFSRLARPDNPWRPAIAVWLLSAFLFGFLFFLWPKWHVLGTDTTGNDVLFVALKSVRTAVAIGSLATLSALPFAVVFGIAAGYFKGWVDDVVQYIYTTISSIPSVLLIAASVLMIEVFIDKNPTLYETGLQRADLRLFLLALIVGVTGWASLARLLRAETMKISAMDFVTAAKAFGVSSLAIMMRHVLPNVMHIVLIVTVLDFSSVVLYEAVLSYIGVGVDPSMDSFGSMINAAAVEMSRSPTVWWNFLAAFLFMVTLVLSVNLFAAAVRDAFDPKGGQGR